jgi:hypothetical protein
MTLPETCPRCGGDSWTVAQASPTWAPYRVCTSRLRHYTAPWPAMGIEAYPHVENLCGFRTDMTGQTLPDESETR